MKTRSILSCFNRSNDPAEQKNEPKKVFGWNPFLIYVCLTSTIGIAVPVGYSLSVLNTLVMFIKSWSHETVLNRYNTNLSDTQIQALWAAYVSIIAAGAIPGSTVGAWCANKFGRKKTVLMGAFFLFSGGILLFSSRAASSVEMFLVGRLFCGIAAGLLFTTFPIYLMEITPAELNATVGVFLNLGSACGVILGQVLSLPQVLGTEEHWNYALGFNTLFTAGSLLLSYWYPESPIWLFQIKKNEELDYHELRRLRGPNSEDRIKQEMDEMRATNKAEGEKNKTSFMSVLRDRTLLLPILLVLTFGFSTQFSGMGVLMSYSVEIFTKAGFTLEQAGWMNLGCGFLNLLVSFLGPYLMGNFNRRTLMTISSIPCGFSILCLTFSLTYIDEASWLPAAAIIFQLILIVCYPIGMGPIASFIASELFEVEPRSVAMSIGSLSTWVGNLIASMAFPLLLNVMNFYAFIPCSAVCFYVCLFSWMYLPETRNRNPSEVKPLMANGLRSRVRSSNRQKLTVAE